MTRIYGTPAHLRCDLCGELSLDVRSGLACYAHGFERIDRCMDHQSCRDRVEDAGGTWALIDLTHPTEATR